MTTRRKYLRSLALGVAGGLAGCPLGGDRGNTSRVGVTDSPTTPNDTPTGTPYRSLPPGKLASRDGDEADQFGSAVAIDGDRALVAAHEDDNPHGENAGAAYVFESVDSEWVQRAKLTPGDGNSNDRFGSAVALRGELALIGAIGEEDPSGPWVGAAYVFEFVDGDWTERAKLTADDGDKKDRFGAAVTLSDRQALVGAPDDGPNGKSSGSAYVFEFVDGEWVERTKLTADDGHRFDNFGDAVALTERRALVGAPGVGDKHTHPAPDDSGAVYAFEIADGEWVQDEKLVGERNEDAYFGSSVALEEDRALVGAPGWGTETSISAGATYVFETADGEWSGKTVLTATDGDSRDDFGNSVALSDGMALIGAPGDENPNGDHSGSTYVFENAGAVWTQRTKLSAEDGTEHDNFGKSVALSGNRALVGAPSDWDPNGKFAGSAYVFSVGTEQRDSAVTHVRTLTVPYRRGSGRAASPPGRRSTCDR